MRRLFTCKKEFLVDYHYSTNTTVPNGKISVKEGSWWYFDEGGPTVHPELDVRLCAMVGTRWLEMTKERLEVYFKEMTKGEV